jgi:hypothetical protein
MGVNGNMCDAQINFSTAWILEEYSGAAAFASLVSAVLPIAGLVGQQGTAGCLRTESVCDRQLSAGPYCSTKVRVQ